MFFFFFFQYSPRSRCDILVCAIGHKPMLKDRLTIIKNLWTAGLKAELLQETIQVLTFFYFATSHVTAWGTF